jgi:hypothetical protein
MELPEKLLAFQEPGTNSGQKTRKRADPAGRHMVDDDESTLTEGSWCGEELNWASFQLS